MSYEHKAFDEFTFPLSRLETIPGKKDNQNNTAIEPQTAEALGRRVQPFSLFDTGEPIAAGSSP